MNPLNYDLATFQVIAETSPAGICLVDGAELRIKWANRLYREFFETEGRSGELEGMLLTELVPNFADSGMEQIFRNVMATRELYKAREYRYEGYKRGVTFWHWSLHAMPAPPDQTPDLMIQALDITETARAREVIEAHAYRIEQRRRIYETMLSVTPDFNFLFDLSGRFLFANQAFTRHVQRPPEIIAGKNFLNLGYPYQLATHLQQQIEQVIASKQQIKIDSALTVDASEHTREYVFVPVLNEYGDVEAVAGAARDIRASSAGLQKQAG